MRAARTLAVLAACSLAFAIPSCDSGPEAFVMAPPSPPAAAGLPPVRFDRTARNHVVVIDAATPGYAVEFDGVTQAFDRDSAHITLRRPPEGVGLPQVVVQHAVDTRVALTRPVAVYLRMVDARQEKRGVAFQLVGEQGSRGGAE